MAGLTKDGLDIKRQIDVINDLKGNAIPIFQDLVTVGDVVDTSDDSTLGRIIGLYSTPLSELWELAQGVYTAFDPDGAYGKSLDDIVAYLVLTRLGRTKSFGEVLSWSVIGTELNRGDKVRDIYSHVYTNTTSLISSTNNCNGIGFEITLPPVGEEINLLVALNNREFNFSYIVVNGDSVENIKIQLLNKINNLIDFVGYEDENLLWLVPSERRELFSLRSYKNVNPVEVINTLVVESDEFSVPPIRIGELKSIATPKIGWIKVENIVVTTGGREVETDVELRERFKVSKGRVSNNLMESLLSRLYEITGIKSVLVIENVEDYTSIEGIPAHSFMTIVEGGLDREIAQAIWENRPLGIKDFGDISVSILDTFGFTRTVYFARPKEKEVFVKMNLTKFSNYPQDGDNTIIDNLFEYINGLDIGDDLVYSRLFTPINKVVGHQVDSLEVSVDGIDWFIGNIDANFDGRLYTSKANIEVS